MELANLPDTITRYLDAGCGRAGFLPTAKPVSLPVPSYFMVNALPTTHINGDMYIIDSQLKEFRNVDNPQDVISFASVAEDALDEFWNSMVKQFPDAKTGDLSPERSIRLSVAAEAAVAEWITNNCL